MTREVQELRDSVHKTERDISAFERQMWDDEQVFSVVFVIVVSDQYPSSRHSGPAVPRASVHTGSCADGVVTNQAIDMGVAFSLHIAWGNSSIHCSVRASATRPHVTVDRGRVCFTLHAGAECRS